MTAEPEDLDRRAQEILRANDRGGYTVPTSGLYPFQWNWDSALVALGWATFDPARAWQEIQTLFSAQWPDGMVPHIVFHRPDPGYFPGPEIWATGRTPPTSGITQPPVAASCARMLFEADPDRERARREIAALFPKLLAWHRWFHTFRDPESRGVVATVHPWETGMDNSPAWDGPLGRVEVAPDLTPYERRDLQHVDASERPTKAEYDRYMTLVELFRSVGYDPREVVARSPFLVADPCTNFLLLRGDRDLLALARVLGDRDAAAELEAWIERAEQGLPALLRDPATGFWHARDLRTDERLPVRTNAAFLAFFAGLGDAPLAQQLAAWLDATPHVVATVEPGAPVFDPRRYWRGPVWAIVNWMIARGVQEFGVPDAAKRIRASTRRLIEGAGFREYFHPLDGSGLGGRDFSWTAAMWLWWANGADREDLRAATRSDA